MKKLHRKTMAKLLIGAMVLGGTLHFNEVVSQARTKQVSYMQLEEFIKKNRGSFVLDKYLSTDGVTSKNYNTFEDFKRDIFALEKGHYLVHVGRSSISFYKK